MSLCQWAIVYNNRKDEGCFDCFAVWSLSVTSISQGSHIKNKNQYLNYWELADSCLPRSCVLIETNYDGRLHLSGIISATSKKLFDGGIFVLFPLGFSVVI